MTTRTPFTPDPELDATLAAIARAIGLKPCRICGGLRADDGNEPCIHIIDEGDSDNAAT